MDFIHITAPYYEVWISFFHKKMKELKWNHSRFLGTSCHDRETLCRRPTAVLWHQIVYAPAKGVVGTLCLIQSWLLSISMHRNCVSDVSDQLLKRGWRTSQVQMDDGTHAAGSLFGDEGWPCSKRPTAWHTPTTSWAVRRTPPAHVFPKPQPLPWQTKEEMNKPQCTTSASVSETQNYSETEREKAMMGLASVAFFFQLCLPLLMFHCKCERSICGSNECPLLMVECMLPSLGKFCKNRLASDLTWHDWQEITALVWEKLTLPYSRDHTW